MRFCVCSKRELLSIRIDKVERRQNVYTALCIWICTIWICRQSNRNKNTKTKVTKLRFEHIKCNILLSLVVIALLLIPGNRMFIALCLLSLDLNSRLFSFLFFLGCRRHSLLLLLFNKITSKNDNNESTTLYTIDIVVSVDIVVVCTRRTRTESYAHGTLRIKMFENGTFVADIFLRFRIKCRYSNVSGARRAFVGTTAFAK